MELSKLLHGSITIDHCNETICGHIAFCPEFNTTHKPRFEWRQHWRRWWAVDTIVNLFCLKLLDFFPLFCGHKTCVNLLLLVRYGWRSKHVYLTVIDKDTVSTQGYDGCTQGPWKRRRKGRIEDFGNRCIMEYGHIIVIIITLSSSSSSSSSLSSSTWPGTHHHHHHHAPHLHDPGWAQLGL